MRGRRPCKYGSERKGAIWIANRGLVLPCGLLFTNHAGGGAYVDSYVCAPLGRERRRGAYMRDNVCAARRASKVLQHPHVVVSEPIAQQREVAAVWGRDTPRRKYARTRLLPEDLGAPL